MGRNLPAPRSGAARIGVLTAPRPRSARLIAQLVVGLVAAGGGLARSALLGGGLASARLRRTPGLGAAIRLLRPGAAGLVLAIP